MVKHTHPPAPQHLSKRSKAFWRRTVAAYELDDGHLEVLSRLCEAMDRCDQARDALDEQGVTFRDKFNQLKPNPAAVIEVQNRSQVLKLLQALRLGEAELVSSTQSAQALARKRWSKA